MELFKTITTKELVMHSIKVLQEQLVFLDSMIVSCDNPEMKEKLSGLLAANNAQFVELSQWFAEHYSVDSVDSVDSF